MVTMNEAALMILRETSDFQLSTQTLDITRLAKFSGHILADDICSPLSLPPFPASIKDGYAVIAQDGCGHRRVLARSSNPGQDCQDACLKSGCCVRISTGAAVPPEADAVVQIEDTELVENDGELETVISILKAPQPGQDIRPVGSDISVGQLLLAKHTSLGPVELGLIASVRCTTARVFIPPRVAIMSTGDEVVDPASCKSERPLNSIYDSNRTLLQSLLVNFGEPLDLGICQDTPDSVYTFICRGLDEADVLITTGSVSMGERDLIKRILVQDFKATIHFGRVNLKPGKPTTFATCIHKSKKKFIFALPGNPVSAYVTFQLFVQPALRLLKGEQITNNNEERTLFTLHRTIPCRLMLSDPGKPYKLDKERPEFARCRIEFDTNKQQAEAWLTESNQISSRLLNSRQANALVLLPCAKEVESDVLENDSVLSAFLL